MRLVGFWLIPVLALLLLLSIVIGLLHPEGAPFGVDVTQPGFESLGFSLLAAILVAVFQLRWLGALLTIIIGGMLAGLLEVVQIMAPFRDAAWSDWVLNVVSVGIGSLVGLTVGYVLSRLLPKTEA